METGSSSQAIGDEGWDTLANMLNSMQIDLGKKRGKLKKLQKEMEVVKHILYEQLRSFNGNQSVDMSFFVGTMKTVSRIEEELEKHGIENNEFMVFLNIVLDRIKKQRLVVKKPMEMQKEFGKLKGVVEDANLQETDEDNS